MQANKRNEPRWWFCVTNCGHVRDATCKSSTPSLTVATVVTATSSDCDPRKGNCCSKVEYLWKERCLCPSLPLYGVMQTHLNKLWHHLEVIYLEATRITPFSSVLFLKNVSFLYPSLSTTRPPTLPDYNCCSKTRFSAFYILQPKLLKN